MEKDRFLTIDVVDISGTRVATLYEELFRVGENRREWDGSLGSGQKIGSGVYVITLISDDKELVCWKKVVVRR